MSGPLRIDVSSYRRLIDWDKAAAAGVVEAILRFGVAHLGDPYAAWNYMQCGRLNIDRGAYWAAYPGDGYYPDVTAQAFFYALMGAGWKPWDTMIKLPSGELIYSIWDDIEGDFALKPSELTAWHLKFLRLMDEQVKNEFGSALESMQLPQFVCGYYGSPRGIGSRLEYHADLYRRPNWVANYDVIYPELLWASGSRVGAPFARWQKSKSGEVPGIVKFVDINIAPEDIAATPADERRQVISPIGLRVRSGASTAHRHLYSLRFGDVVEVYETAGWWVRIDPDTDQWCHAGWTRLLT